MAPEVRQIDAWDRINGWSKAPDPVLDDIDDWETALHAAGYATWWRVPADSVVFMYHAYRNTDGRFLVSIDTCDTWDLVSIPDLASLMEFLRLYLPLVQVGMADELMEKISDLYDLLAGHKYGLLADQVGHRNQIRAEEARARRARQKASA